MEPVCVIYRTTLDVHMRAHIMMHLIKHLLYIRGQIPCLYHEVLLLVKRNQLNKQPKQKNIRPMRGGMKKAVKCITVTEMFFNVQLIAAFSHKVRRVALVFGASMMSPREAVIVEFLEQKAAVDGSKSSSVGSFEELETQSALLPPSREELERLCAQKLMREVFTHIMKHMDSTLPVTQLHVAVLAEQQSTSIPGFIPKQNFKLRLPKDKRHVQAHYIKIFVNTDRATRTESEEFYQISTSSEQSQCYPEEMWHVLSKPIPGFSEVIDVIEA